MTLGKAGPLGSGLKKLDDGFLRLPTSQELSFREAKEVAATKKADVNFKSKMEGRRARVRRARVKRSPAVCVVQAGGHGVRKCFGTVPGLTKGHLSGPLYPALCWTVGRK